MEMALLMERIEQYWEVFIPKATAGMTLSADWKGFDLNMVFSGVFGRKQHSPMSFKIVCLIAI